jgi:hypothetical protein
LTSINATRPIRFDVGRNDHRSRELTCLRLELLSTGALAPAGYGSYDAQVFRMHLGFSPIPLCVNEVHDGSNARPARSERCSSIEQRSSSWALGLDP